MRFHSSLAAVNLVYVRLTENNRLTYKIKQNDNNNNNNNNNNDNSNNLHTSD